MFQIPSFFFNSSTILYIFIDPTGSYTHTVTKLYKATRKPAYDTCYEERMRNECLKKYLKILQT